MFSQKTVLFLGVLVTSAIRVSAHNSLAQPLRFAGDATAGPVTADTYPCGVGSAGIASAYAAAPVAGTYNAGGNIDVLYSSTTVHEGGSCQFSVSNDNGVTFKVLLSIEGMCPDPVGATVPIPSSFPGGEYMFAWSWMPRASGAAEYYHACSKISISGTGSASDLDSLPTALLAVVNTCQPDESSGHLDLIFPNPGNQVIINRAPTAVATSMLTPMLATAVAPGYGLIAAGCAAQMAGASASSNTTVATAVGSANATAVASDDGSTYATADAAGTDSIDATNSLASVAGVTLANKAVVHTTPLALASGTAGTATAIVAATTAVSTGTTTGGSDCNSAWSACNAAWQAGGSTGAYTCQTDFVTCRSGSATGSTSGRRKSPRRVTFNHI